MSDDEYDKLSKEEKEAKDKADREREVAEQAGRKSLSEPIVVRLMLSPSSSIYLGAGVGRSRHRRSRTKRDTRQGSFYHNSEEASQCWNQRER